MNSMIPHYFKGIFKMMFIELIKQSRILLRAYYIFFKSNFFKKKKKVRVMYMISHKKIKCIETKSMRFLKLIY